eukprot:gene8991-1613_t
MCLSQVFAPAPSLPDVSLFTRHARQVISDNGLEGTPQADALQALAKPTKQALESGGDALLPDMPWVTDNTAPLWQCMEQYVGRPWVEAPWLYGEVFFFHLILHLSSGHQPNAGPLQDIFSRPKMASLHSATAPILALLSAVDQAETKAGGLAGMVPHLLHACLWGNQVDLCMFTDGRFEDGSFSSVSFMAMYGAEGKPDSSILCDNTQQIAQALNDLPDGSTLAVIADNFGYELFTDLVLIDVLLRVGLVHKVKVHVKTVPYYVSDATLEDIGVLVDHMRALQGWQAQAFSASLSQHQKLDRLTFANHPFWDSPLEFIDMPSCIREDLRQAALVIVKGDLNYRKLVGDRHWSHTAPFSAAVSYFPAPVASLRTLKSELVVGLAPEVVAQARSHDPQWLVSGSYGVIQFYNPFAASASVTVSILSSATASPSPSYFNESSASALSSPMGPPQTPTPPTPFTPTPAPPATPIE